MTPDDEETPWLDVCVAADLPECTAVPFRVNERELLLCRTDGRIFAIADRCTHAAWSLAGGRISGCEIACTLHGARFDVRTGEATAHPASVPIRTFPVRIRAGRVEVRATPPPR